jgi:hypothetical protein
MGQVSTLLRRTSVRIVRWTGGPGEKPRLLSKIGRSIERARAELGMGLRKLRGKLRSLKAATRASASSR